MAATVAALVGNIGSRLCAFIISSIIAAGETALVSTFYRRRETYTSTTVGTILRHFICSDLMVCSLANSVCRWQGTAHLVQSVHRFSHPLTLRRHCISSAGPMSLS